MLDLFGKRLAGIVNKYLKKVQTKFKQLTNTRKLINKLTRGFEQKIKKIILSTPSSLDDYFKILNRYVAKKIFVIVILVILAFVFVFYRYLFPWMEGRLWIPHIVVNTPKFHSYSGKAKVITEDKKLIYFGEMQDGRITGRGNLYDKEGNLIYSGDFSKEQYEGYGEKYDENGNLVYKGMFANGKYEGKGKHYQGSQLIYDGEFKNGLYEGTGTKFYPNGNLMYQGLFQGGEMYGNGRLYDSEGRLLYKGYFLDGLYDGEGIQYDPRSGQILYEGQFKQGSFHGTGKLYDGVRGRLIYEGEFKEGLYSGSGTLYNSLGQVVYQGHFYAGEIDYIQYINSEAQKVREAFGPEDQVVLFDSYFITFFDETKTAFTFDYGEISAPRVNKMIFLGNQRFLDIERGITLKDLENLFGQSYSEVNFDIDEEKELVLRRLGIKEYPEELVGIKFIIDDQLFIRAYFLDSQDEVLYYEIGEV